MQPVQGTRPGRGFYPERLLIEHPVQDEKKQPRPVLETLLALDSCLAR